MIRGRRSSCWTGSRANRFLIEKGHQRNLAPLDLLEWGSSDFLMMNLLEILAVEPLVVEPLKDDPLLVEPLAELLKYDPLVEPLEDDDPLLVERLYDDPLLVEPFVAKGLSYKQ